VLFVKERSWAIDEGPALVLTRHLELSRGHDDDVVRIEHLPARLAVVHA
jgi:hypothetical protein